MTLFHIGIKILKQFRLSSKPPEQSVATLQFHYTVITTFYRW